MGLGLAGILVAGLAVAFLVSALAAMVLVSLVPRRSWPLLLAVICPLLALWPVMLAWIDRL
jgi:hypothetical protein